MTSTRIVHDIDDIETDVISSINPTCAFPELDCELSLLGWRRPFIGTQANWWSNDDYTIKFDGNKNEFQMYFFKCKMGDSLKYNSTITTDDIITWSTEQLKTLLHDM